MKKVTKYLMSACLSAAAGALFAACDDWTDTESLDLEYATVADSESYAAYLANLREYRSRDHKLVYAWFDNAGEFTSQGHRLTALPDSVDVVVLNNPAAVTDKLLDEMAAVRADKGMQVIYCISFDAIKADWTALCEELALQRLAYADGNYPAELQDPAFADYMAGAWAEQLSYFNAVGFDGLMFAFNGKATAHLTTAELADYTAQADLFLGIITDWHQRNPAVPIDYMGKPQNIADKAILADVRTVFLADGLNAGSQRGFDIVMGDAAGAVPTAKLAMVASMRAINLNADPNTGFFADGTMAVDGLAEWTAANAVGAVGVVDASNDYFVTVGQYATLRSLIQTVNPSAK